MWEPPKLFLATFGDTAPISFEFDYKTDSVGVKCDKNDTGNFQKRGSENRAIVEWAFIYLITINYFPGWPRSGRAQPDLVLNSVFVVVRQSTKCEYAKKERPMGLEDRIPRRNREETCQVLDNSPRHKDSLLWNSSLMIGLLLQFRDW